MHKFHVLAVRDVQPDAEDAVRLTLEVPPSLESTFRSQAGQHVVVRLLLEGIEQRRTYSVIGRAGELPLTLVVRMHERGRCSLYLGRALRRGDQLELMPPTGSFGAALAQAAEAPRGALYVMFVAGSGITPVLSIVHTALAEQPRARVLLFFGNRNSARTMCFEDLQALKNRFMGRIALHFLMSDEPQEVQLLNGRIDGAKVRALAEQLFDAGAVDAYFVCGPGTMIEDVGRELRALGVAPERIHAEHFNLDAHAEHAQATPHAGVGRAITDAESETPRAPAALPAAEPSGHTEVTVLMDGRRRTFPMRTADETILDAAARAGLDLPYSCRAGVCSTCRTKLLRGAVEMRENYALEDWELEQGYILACQSRAKTPELELDYDAR
ncbi:MAG TPA: 2Fe-2S iron-sulfur cluster-binding protein [Steroidobacteraceae bacterium]|nr:2Fe-2S iron-sulfur cluster-binding protein [Steroidobacteraceae bacterium]